MKDFEVIQKNLVPKHKGLKITLNLDAYEQKVWMMKQPTTLNAEDQQLLGQMGQCGSRVRTGHHGSKDKPSHSPHQSISVVLPKVTLLRWAHGSSYSLSCGEQAPDVGIPHHRDARMQHSPVCPSAPHTG